MIYFIIADTNFGSHVEQISTDFNKLRENFPDEVIYTTDYMNVDDTLYNIIDYSNNIYSLMNEARVVISRAGAITISELIYINKPFITIPSKNTKDNH